MSIYVNINVSFLTSIEYVILNTLASVVSLAISDVLPVNIHPSLDSSMYKRVLLSFEKGRYTY